MFGVHNIKVKLAYAVGMRIENSECDAKSSHATQRPNYLQAKRIVSRYIHKTKTPADFCRWELAYTYDYNISIFSRRIR